MDAVVMEHVVLILNVNVMQIGVQKTVALIALLAVIKTANVSNHKDVCVIKDIINLIVQGNFVPKIAMKMVNA